MRWTKDGWIKAGGGDLSAMIRWDGSLHLHLSKSDGWGFQAAPDALPGTRFDPARAVIRKRIRMCPGARRS